MKFPTLFKYASSGAVQQWDIEAGQYADGTAYYTTRYGKVGGSIQETTVDIDVGKNIGKKNETSPLEQACQEARAKWTKQQDRRGYSNGKPKKVANTAPMLAKSYEKEIKKVKFPCYYQPKLDGMRCIAEKSNQKIALWSRQGKTIETLPHIVSILDAIMINGQIADGELYTHGTVTFQTLLSWIKRAQKDTVKVRYNVYDLVSDDPFNKRFIDLCHMVGQKGKGIVKTVYTDKVHSHSDVQAKLADQLSRGYEGIMLRIGDCTYASGRRSSELLKVKNFQDEEFEIVDAYENIGKHKGQCTLVCKTNNGTTFGVKPIGDDAQRRKYWDDFNAGKLKGKMLTVKFFEWTTSDSPVPRFPVGIAVRDYD